MNDKLFFILAIIGAWVYAILYVVAGNVVDLGVFALLITFAVCTHPDLEEENG
jgi:hypothetical protein